LWTLLLAFMRLMTEYAHQSPTGSIRQHRMAQGRFASEGWLQPCANALCCNTFGDGLQTVPRLKTIIEIFDGLMGYLSKTSIDRNGTRQGIIIAG